MKTSRRGKKGGTNVVARIAVIVVACLIVDIALQVGYLVSEVPDGLRYDSLSDILSDLRGGFVLVGLILCLWRVF